jgi:hypothetical protein
MSKHRLTLKQSEDGRKTIMNALSNAHEKAKKESLAWLDVDEIRHPDKSPIAYARAIASSLLRLGLIDTEKRGDKLFARITQYGLSMVARGQGFTYNTLQKSLQVPHYVYERVERIAKELNITRGAGRGAGVNASVVGLLIAIGEKPDLFKKWFLAVYPEVKDGK